MTISSVGAPAAQPVHAATTAQPTVLKSQTPAAATAPVSKPAASDADGDNDGSGGRINVKA